mmetsp:Transcript_13806/g.17474  ORF Transcript_13806/g.17474 Transcript_13806/m.17474 type:complete len:196 (-) Transcript_13806:1024-1611(-)|eukprot:CAMPEP_0170471138 /NCGR_PEP_ID=MMETSP0123-20130129/13431_1 /TAXON_ID=182087 /ORGANISM="Favella ehrenbergii, Strain Fehren 1" /LENGTH=195 /DNA_ID=CAMNT_0010738633 /DNA_START=295 /DNA_END=882 /DNA_ORIENTATION=+
MDYEKQSNGIFTKTFTWVPAIYCRDKFASLVEKYPNSDVAQKLSKDSTWVCPDTDQIILNRNPFLETDMTGTNFVMVVNDCETAREADKLITSGPSYASDKQCLATLEERQAVIQKSIIQTMIMGLTVGVESNGATKNLKFKARSTTGLMTTVVQSDLVQAVPNRLFYRDNVGEQLVRLYSELDSTPDTTTYTFE